MGNIWTIARREYKQYFNGPVAYAVAILFFLVLGIFFYAEISQALTNAYFQSYTPTARIVTGNIIIILMFTIPAVTMRLMAEEQRSGTLELLMTAPVRDLELVVGKWLGAMLFMLTLLLITWVYPILLNAMTSPGIDQGPLLTGYLGLILLVSSLVAIGVAISALFANQIAAFFVTLAVVLGLWLLYQIVPSADTAAGKVVDYLGIIGHYIGFYNGEINLKDIIYYLSVTALFLFLGSRVVEMRRWR